MACDYTTNEPEFEDISEEAKEFIKKLLVINSRERLSAEEALNHSWLNQSHKKSRRVSMLETSPKLTDVMSRLKWQKCTNVIVACTKLQQSLNQ